MKKFVLLIFLCISLLIVCGCKTQEASQNFQTNEIFQAVLLNNKNFVSTDLQNKKLSLKNIKQVVTDEKNISVAVTKFSLINVNQNEKGIALCLQINGGADCSFEIFHCQNGIIYGCTLPYRAFEELKTDGTFLFSSGAADSGIGKIEFVNEKFSVKKLFHSESHYNANNELEVLYFAKGAPCSSDEFDRAMRQQQKKSGAKWYDFTPENLNLIFKNAL